MLEKNKFWKSLLGKRADIIVAPNVEYTDDATYAAFVTNAVEGEVGVFNAATLAAYDGLAAAAAGAKVFVAMKRNGLIERTADYTIGTATLVRNAYVAAAAQVSDIVTSGSPVAGKVYGVKVIETTAGHAQFPTWNYEVVAKTGETLTQLVTRLAALINDTANIVNKNTDPCVTASLVNTDDIRLTAIVAGATFRIAMSEAMLELGTATYTAGSGRVVGTYGNGTYAQVAALEQIGDEYKGVTTQYDPGLGANPEDFGKPSVLAAAGVTYNIYTLTQTISEPSPTPTDQTIRERLAFVAVPSSGTGPEGEVKTILGL